MEYEARDDRVIVRMPAGQLSAEALRNLVYMLYAKQYLINRATGSEALCIQSSVISDLQRNPPETLAAFAEWIGDHQKKDHIIGFDFDGQDIAIGFPLTHDPDSIQAFMALTVAVVRKAARMKDRPPAACLEPANERFYMHNWLRQLGLTSVSHKRTREIFLDRLDGHASFRTAEQADKARETVREIRRIGRELAKEER